MITSKLAPTRKRPKRVAKKIERRLGLAHYDKKAIRVHRQLSVLIRSLFRAVEASIPVRRPAEEGSSVKVIPVMRPVEFITIKFSRDISQLDEGADDENTNA